MLMKKYLFLIFVILFFAGCQHKDFFTENTDAQVEREKLRVISLAPSITNMIIALDGGESLVGVTKFCQNPENKWTLIGGYMDFDREVFVSLKPNLVFLAPFHSEAKEICREMNIDYVELDIDSFKSIRQNIMVIGKKIGKTEKAAQLVDNFNKEMFKVKISKTHPRVLVVLDRNYGTRDFGKIYAVGDGGIFAEPISICGGFNAYEGIVETPVLSAEGIVSINPDVIIDVTNDKGDEIKKDWEGLNVNAVKNHNLFVLSGKKYSTPDEKFYETVQKISEMIYETK